MISLIYVSQTRIDPRNRDCVLADILTVAIARNTMLGLTGLLIASPDYFVQLIEGPVLGVKSVMSRIEADSRHSELRIVRQSTIEKARCPQWRMARLDSANFGATVINPLVMAVHAGEGSRALRRLERLIDSVATDSVLVQKSYFLQ